MDYIKVYNQLIDKAKKRKKVEGYKEIHHIIPVSEGGQNTSENLVELTAREHFLAHWLLFRANPTQSRAFAFHAMTGTVKGKSSRYTPSSRVIQEAREEVSRIRKSIVQSPETRQKNREQSIGRIMMNNGVSEIFIWPEEKTSYEEKGWKKGRTQKNRIKTILNGKKGAECSKLYENRVKLSKGIYSTPKGNFIASNEAARANNCATQTVINRCKKNKNGWFFYYKKTLTA